MTNSNLRNELYNMLVNEPIISNEIVFHFQPRETTNLADLVVTDRNGERILLTDYIINEELRLRIKTVSLGNLVIVFDTNNLQEGVDYFFIGDYLSFSIDSFQNFASVGRFSVVMN